MVIKFKDASIEIHLNTQLQKGSVMDEYLSQSQPSLHL